MDVILFLVFALFAVACAINVVVQTHPIASAISLIGVMASLAVLYLLLGAEFIAAAQVIVYAGAIMVLFVFVIMLLNAGAESKSGRSLVAQALGVPSLVALLGILAFFVQRLFPRESATHFGGFTGRNREGRWKSALHHLFIALRGDLDPDPDCHRRRHRFGVQGDGLRWPRSRFPGS
jgi:NADH-quinone oxidoreductase subunit J